MICLTTEEKPEKLCWQNKLASATNTLIPQLGKQRVTKPHEKNVVKMITLESWGVASALGMWGL